MSADVNFGTNLKWGLGLLLNEAQQPGMRAARLGQDYLNIYEFIRHKSAIRERRAHGRFG